MRIVIGSSFGKSLYNFRGELIKEWVKLGHEVICFSIEPAEEMGNKISQLGAKYYQIPGTRTGTNIVKDIKMFFDYIKAFKKFKPDIYFGYMSKPVAYGGIAARLCNIKQRTFFVTGLEIAFYSKGIKNLIIRFVLKTFFRIAHKNAENIVFQNTDDYHTFLKMGLVKKEQATIVGGSGVDLTHFTKKAMPSKDSVLMTARLVWSKGVREYIEAAKVVKAKYPEVEFVLVGGLDENPEALSKSELNELIHSGVMKWYDFVEDVRPFLEQCSIFVLPSYHEGRSRSILEADATGRPVITTNAPGCRETILDGYNGFLVPVGDHLEISQHIIELLENNELKCKMAENSYELACREFDVKIVNKTFLKLMGLLD